MKRLSLFLIVFTLFASCDKDVYEEIVYEKNYFSLNGELYAISLTEGQTYQPTSLNADTENDAYNPVMVVLNDDYSITFDGEEYVSGRIYELRLDELSKDRKVEIVVTNNTTNDSYTSYIETYPDDIPIGEITTSANLEDGYYYYGNDEGGYLSKINTKGELIFYKKTDRNALFNRTELSDGTVYYSYQEAVDNSTHPTVSSGGYYTAKAVIMDANYQVVDELTSLVGTRFKGHSPEGHHFTIHDLGHYTITAYIPMTVYDIPGLNGKGVYLTAAVAQEIKDGELVFEWCSTDYTELYTYFENSGKPALGEAEDGVVIDYAHINSVAVDPADGNWVMSFRHLSSLVKVDRAGETGDIIWLLSGLNGQEGYSRPHMYLTDNSGASIDKTFFTQHDIKFVGDNTFTFYNNNNHIGVTTGQDPAATMRLTITGSTVGGSSSITSFERFDGDYASNARGSSQQLSENNILMNWGTTSSNYVFTEYDFSTTPATKLFEMAKPDTYGSYRAYKYSK